MKKTESVVAGVASTIRFDVEREAVAAALETLADRAARALDPRVADSVRYALLGAGKRLRAILLIAAYRATGGRGDASALAAAVEVVHAYSLVHDDLPCMDDDDVRRGRPTVHRKHGVIAATAAGVAMVPLAAQAAVEAASALGLSEAAQGEIVRTLMQASGASGMIEASCSTSRPKARRSMRRSLSASTGSRRARLFGRRFDSVVWPPRQLRL